MISSVTFNGLLQVVRASFSFAPGISPSTATLDIAPQAAPVAERGTLVLAHGQTRLVFPDCKLDMAAATRDAAGQVCQLSILDRRWMWRYGHISGLYNRARPDGALDDDTKRSARRLAELCLAAMGERAFDVSPLPADQYPPTDWDMTNPAQALAELADEFGCHVTLALDNRVRLRRVGTGANLDTDTTLVADSPAIDLVESPDALLAVAAPIRFQFDFELEAVGFEPDGEIKPIDELSYAPTTGWGAIDLADFFGVRDVKLRGLARECVFRAYRVVVPDDIHGFEWRDTTDADVSPGGDRSRLRRLSQVLPIEDQQVETSNDPGRPTPRQAMVYGVFSREDLDAADNLSTSLTPLPSRPTADQTKAIYTRGYRLDLDRGVVHFADYVYRLDSDGLRRPADLRLRAATHVRHAETRQPLRYRRRRSLSVGGATPTRDGVLVRDEIVPAVYARYDRNFRVVETFSNRAGVTRLLDTHLDLAAAAFARRRARSRTYAGLRKFEPDGAIRRVTWDISSSGVTTTAARDDDAPGATTIGHAERRRLEAQTAAANQSRRRASAPARPRS